MEDDKGNPINAALSQGYVNVLQEAWQNYDKDGDGTINTLELIEAIRNWLDNRLSTADLINIIQKWLQG